jgi:hypothetical protein
MVIHADAAALTAAGNLQDPVGKSLLVQDTQELRSDRENDLLGIALRVRTFYHGYRSYLPRQSHPARPLAVLLKEFTSSVCIDLNGCH